MKVLEDICKAHDAGQPEGCDRCIARRKTCIYVPRQKLGRPSTKSQKTSAPAASSAPPASSSLVVSEGSPMHTDIEPRHTVEADATSIIGTMLFPETPTSLPMQSPMFLPTPHESPTSPTHDNGYEDLQESLREFLGSPVSTNSPLPWPRVSGLADVPLTSSFIVPGRKHHHVCFLAISHRLLRAVQSPQLHQTPTDITALFDSNDPCASESFFPVSPKPVPHGASVTPTPARQGLDTLDPMETCQLIEFFFLFHPLSYLINKTAFLRSQATQSTPGPLHLALIAAASCMRQSIGTCKHDHGAEPHHSECESSCQDAFTMALEAIYMRVDECASLEMLQALLIVILQQMLVASHLPNSTREQRGLLHLAWSLAQSLIKQPAHQPPDSTSSSHPNGGGSLTTRRGSVSQEDVEKELANFCWWTCAIFSLYSRIVSGQSPASFLRAMDPTPVNAALTAQPAGSLSSKYDLQHRNMVPTSVYISRLSTFVVTTEICLFAARICGPIESNPRADISLTISEPSSSHLDADPFIDRSVNSDDKDLRGRLNNLIDTSTLSTTDISSQIRQLLYQILAMRSISTGPEVIELPMSAEISSTMMEHQTGSAGSPTRQTTIAPDQWDGAVTVVQDMLNNIAGLCNNAQDDTAEASCQRERFHVCVLGLEVCMEKFQKLSSSLSMWVEALREEIAADSNTAHFVCPATLKARHDWQRWVDIGTRLMQSMRDGQQLMSLLPSFRTMATMYNSLQGLISAQLQRHHSLEELLQKLHLSEMPQQPPQQTEHPQALQCPPQQHEKPQDAVQLLQPVTPEDFHQLQQQLLPQLQPQQQSQPPLLPQGEKGQEGHELQQRLQQQLLQQQLQLQHQLQQQLFPQLGKPQEVFELQQQLQQQQQQQLQLQLQLQLLQQQQQQQQQGGYPWDALLPYSNYTAPDRTSSQNSQTSSPTLNQLSATMKNICPFLMTGTSPLPTPPELPFSTHQNWV
ncbi:hypothetical protein DFJ77DRAFT_474515 [Powellomyces hirtus]|nr:hypothetical protein DFJ77DRAFT_474515 [Powellomyces hirtus]